MPGGGSKPGERRGGRKKGVPNIRTVERELRARAYVDAVVSNDRTPSRAFDRANFEAKEAARRVQEAEAEGFKLAKNMLEDFAKLFWNEAVRHQKAGDIESFKEWALLCCGIARDLAPYQSPKLSAVMVSAPPPEPRSRRFTLAIFDRHNGNGSVPVAEIDALANEDE